MSGITNKILECRSSAETPRIRQTSGRASGARSGSTRKSAHAKTTKSSRKLKKHFRNIKTIFLFNSESATN